MMIYASGLVHDVILGSETIPGSIPPVMNGADIDGQPMKRTRKK